MASLARTILEEHLVRGELTPGTEIAIAIDQTLAHRLAPPVDLPSAVRRRVATIRQERV